MDPSIATLTGVIVGALTTLLAGFLAGRHQTQLEREKWERARQEEAERSIRAAVADFTKKMAAGVQVVVWLTWHAKNNPDKLIGANLAEYEKEMKSLYLELVGSRIAVAALSQEVHNQLTPLVNNLYRLDEEVSHTILLFPDSPEQCIQKLSEYHAEAYDLEVDLVKKVSGFLSLDKIPSKVIKSDIVSRES
jgi:hypothetical protein